MKKFSTFLSILIFSNILFSQPNNSKVDSILQTRADSNSTVAISIGIIQNGQKTYYNYGTIDRQSSTKVNEETVFEIGSVTKIITTNLIAQAVLEHKLTLGDFIDNYLPENYQLKVELKNKVKISDLASHQSGLPDIDFRSLIQQNPLNPLGSVTQNTLDSLINTADSLIDFGKYRYSTIGYVLLGQILETVYQKNYDELLQEKLVQPLNLTTTLTKNYNVANKVTGYNPEGGVQDPFAWNFMAPAGLIKSSTSDMVNYLDAVLNSTQAISTAAKLTEQPYLSENGRSLGLGINIAELEGDTIYVKSGDTMGQSSMIAYNREKKAGFIILLNERNSKIRNQLFYDLNDLILK